MSNRTVLLRIGVLIEVDEAEVESEFGEVDRIENSVTEAIDATLGIEDGSSLGWCSSQRWTLDKDRMNCGQRVVCGTWVTDREEVDPLRELGNGAVVDGRLLCDDHLPSGHRWAF